MSQTTQDEAVRLPRVRLRLVLALLRILAGRRGHAAVAWHGAGFTYRLSTVREDGDDAVVTIDHDPTAIGAADILDRLRDRLRRLPS